MGGVPMNMRVNAPPAKRGFEPVDGASRKIAASVQETRDQARFEREVEKVHNDVVAVYRAGKQSSDKAYVDGSLSSRGGESDVDAADHAARLVDLMDSFRTSSLAAEIKHRDRVLDRMAAGNALDLSYAAADLAIYRRLHAEVRSFGCDGQDLKIIHRVAVFARNAEDLETNSQPPGSASSPASSVWVSDPWMDVCCSIDEYPDKAVEAMETWAKEGQWIRDERTSEFVKPDNSAWMDTIRAFGSDHGQRDDGYASLLELKAQEIVIQLAERARRATATNDMERGGR
jgi:hypothetical protein